VQQLIVRVSGEKTNAVADEVMASGLEANFFSRLSWTQERK
jgi:hypothetical protein